MEQLSIQHQGRELLHAIGLLTHCLRLANCGAAIRDDWERSLLCCRENLERLHAVGLPRNFHLPSPRPLPPARTPQAAAPQGADDPVTGLEPWQRELILRLERGLFRR